MAVTLRQSRGFVFLVAGRTDRDWLHGAAVRQSVIYRLRGIGQLKPWI